MHAAAMYMQSYTLSGIYIYLHIYSQRARPATPPAQGPGAAMASSSSRGRAPAGAESQGSPRRSRSREPPAVAGTRQWSLSIMTYNIGVPYQAPENWGGGLKGGGKLAILLAELEQFARTPSSISMLLLQDRA